VVAINIGKIPLELEFEGSFNCCYGCCMSSNTVLYVNKDYKIEVFDFSKSSDYQKDYYKSLSRMKNFTQEYHQAIRDLGGIDITHMDRLTLGEVKKVNQVMRHMQDIWEQRMDDARSERESHIRIRRR